MKKIILALCFLLAINMAFAHWNASDPADQAKVKMYNLQEPQLVEGWDVQLSWDGQYLLFEIGLNVILAQPRNELLPFPAPKLQSPFFFLGLHRRVEE